MVVRLWPIMNATKVRIVILAVMVTGLVVPLAIQRQSNAKLRAEVESLKEQVHQVDTLNTENKRLSNLLARTSTPTRPATNDQFRELMKLRGEVGTLRKTADEAAAVVAAKTNAPSILSGMTQSPEMQKMIRDQQKMGMTMIYKGLAKRANLSPEVTEELNNVLADHVMTNITHVTDVLKAGKTPAEMDAVFSKQETELKEKIKGLLGAEGLVQYEDYTKNLASYLTAEQFKATLPGEKETKEAHGKQMYELMQEETKRVLAETGLPADYQTVPTLNFRNFASEEVGERNLKLLETIYDGVAGRAGSFLSPEELEKFDEFRKMAINNNRLGLTLNRKMMAPPSP
jgi:hypothetical protein